MRDLRPDLVFVVSGAVWRDFLDLREETGDALCNRFLWSCRARIDAALEAGDEEAAHHWTCVLSLATQYGLSFVSAVEVDGELIREQPKHSAFRYPDDHELKRVVIGTMAAHVILHTADPAARDSTWSTTDAVQDSAGEIRIRYSDSKTEVQITVSSNEVEAMRRALMQRLPDTGRNTRCDALMLLAQGFSAREDEASPHESVATFLAEAGIRHEITRRPLLRLAV